jgi:hypothetical protein
MKKQNKTTAKIRHDLSSAISDVSAQQFWMKYKEGSSITCNIPARASVEQLFVMAEEISGVHIDQIILTLGTP